MAQYQQLIHEYLDGPIEPYLEDMLFSELARDNSLRREFQEQMAIHRGASSDMASISTPGDLGNQVFATLGISAVPVDDVPLPLTARRSFKTFTSLFAGAFTVMLVYFLTAQPGDSPKVLKVDNAVKIPQEKVAQNPVQIASNSEGENLLKEASQNVFSANNSFKNIASETERTEDFKGETNSENVEQNFPQQNFNGIFSVNALPSNSYSLKTGTQASFSTQSLPEFISSLLKTYPVAIQLNGASDFKSTNGGTVSVLFDKSENFKLGVEGGYETFVINSTKSVNSEIIKSQERMGNWTAGVVAQLLLPEISPSESFVPFVQLYTGTPVNSNFTLLNKLSTGVIFKANDRFYLLLGGEVAGTLLSKQINNRYQLTAGAGFKF